MIQICQWCSHPTSAHSAYYGGWCAVDVTVVDDGPVPYGVSCWCGGTEGSAGPRIVTSRGNTRLVQGERGEYGAQVWRLP